jgi:hypothetical protein
MPISMLLEQARHNTRLDWRSPQFGQIIAASPTGVLGGSVAAAAGASAAKAGFTACMACGALAGGADGADGPDGAAMGSMRKRAPAFAKRAT